jgi:hypothetical protein
VHKLLHFDSKTPIVHKIVISIPDKKGKEIKKNALAAWPRGALDISSAQEQKTRVRIPPGCSGKPYTAMLLCTIDFICFGLCFEK